VAIQDIWDWASNSEAILGRAVATMLISRLAMNPARNMLEDGLWTFGKRHGGEGGNTRLCKANWFFFFLTQRARGQVVQGLEEEDQWFAVQDPFRSWHGWTFLGIQIVFGYRLGQKVAHPVGRCL